MDEKQLQKYSEMAMDWVVEFVPKIVVAVLVLWIGFKIVARLMKLLKRMLEKSKFSPNLRPFALSTSSFLMKGVIIFVAASIAGVELAGLFTILAAASLAIGMALQGSLGNFASGILILTLKPYKTGDWIQVDDKFGQVEEIGIFSTNVITPGNKILIIPNSKITDDVVTNFSEKGMIRLELEVTMPYAESFPKVRSIIESALADIPKIMKDPAPEIGINTFDSHNVQLLVRPYVLPDDYWEVTFEANRSIKRAFSQNGIKVAYSEGIEIGLIGE
ncbi:MAG: mechanosensitive ion channel family protein [Flavobacteriaceae bacterium]